MEFHPRLTVIAGVGRLEREGLINELVGALGSSRSGVHAELATDSGGRFAVFRPTRGRHRVIDVEQAEHITRFFANEQGEIDVLARAGLPFAPPLGGALGSPRAISRPARRPSDHPAARAARSDRARERRGTVRITEVAASEAA